MFILLFSLVAAAEAKDLTFRVLGVNQKVIYQHTVSQRFPNVGALTHEVLSNAMQSMILNEYRGSIGGVTSINQMGNQIEVLSDREMNAFGWCFQVDGVAPDVMPDALPLRGTEKIITWFYVYAHYKDGKWLSMCTPADHLPRNQI